MRADPRPRREARRGSRRVAAAGLVLALVVAACGGDGALPVLADVDGPIALVDDFELGYGFWDCDSYREPLEPFESALGIDSPAEGFIAANPQRESIAGPAATLGVFMQEAGLVLTDDRVAFAPGDERFDGDTCNGLPGELYVLVWSRPAGPPDLVRRSSLAQIVLAPDGGVIVVAHAVADAAIPLPPWLGGPGAAAPETTTTTAPEDVLIGFEIRAITGIGKEPCTINQFQDGDACLGVGLPAVTRSGIADVVVVTDDDDSRLKLVFTDADLVVVNKLVKSCFEKVPACAVGEFVLVLDGEVLGRFAPDRADYGPDEFLVGPFSLDRAEAAAADILATPIVDPYADSDPTPDDSTVPAAD